MTDSEEDADDVAADESPELARAHEIGTAMVQQLGEMLEEWLDRISELVDAGIDPTPLLRGLSGLMRSAADQLDPDAAKRSETSE